MMVVRFIEMISCPCLLAFADDCERNEIYAMTGKSSTQHLDRLKRAAVTALSAAAVKAKLLAKLEEDEVWKLISP